MLTNLIHQNYNGNKSHCDKHSKFVYTHNKIM